MASLDSLIDEVLADILSRVPQKQALTSLPRVCRWVSAAGCTGLYKPVLKLSSDQQVINSEGAGDSATSCQGRPRSGSAWTSVLQRRSGALKVCYGIVSLFLVYAFNQSPVTDVRAAQAEARPQAQARTSRRAWQSWRDGWPHAAAQ